MCDETLSQVRGEVNYHQPLRLVRYTMHDEDLEARFLEAWQGTGEEYLTRKEIAKKFGFSDGWVQLMLIRTAAKPRRVTNINKQRLDFGVDLREINRRKNLAKYWARQYIITLNAAEIGIETADPESEALFRAENKRRTALRGLERQFHRLKRFLHPKDPFLLDVKGVLDARL